MTIVNLVHPSGSSASISVDRGFNLFEFKAVLKGETVDVIDSESGFAAGEGRVSGNGIPILFPFPNRIRDGKFQWEGVGYQVGAEGVGVDDNGHAIHGFCIDRAWRVIEQTESAVVGEFQLSVDAPERLKLWPADCAIQLRYELDASELRCMVAVKNPDSKPLPWGFGTHPYFRLPFGSASAAKQCLVVGPVDSQWQLIDCLPTGQKSSPRINLSEGVYFGSDRLDDVFGVAATETIECSLIDEAAGIQVTQKTPARYRELVVYTPPNRDSVCLEPYTCVTDAINLQQQGIDAGLEVLAPGETWGSWINIVVSPVLA